MTLATIKQQVLAQIATTSTAAVKQWAEAHGITADLRTVKGWQTVLDTIAQHAAPVAEKAIATTKAVAKAIHEADMVQINEAVCNEAAAIARDLKRFWLPVGKVAWYSAKIAAVWMAIAAIYCIRAGQQLRGFVNEFEYTGLAPHQIGWVFLKPALRRARATVARRWFMVQERAIALSSQRRVRETAIYLASGAIAANLLG